MAKLKIPVVVNMGEIESLIDEIKHLQTYKLFPEDEQLLIDSDDVIKIFMNHVRVNIEQGRKKGRWITKSTNGEMFDCCSACGYVEWNEPKNFCPNCGTKMEEGADG